MNKPTFMSRWFVVPTALIALAVTGCPDTRPNISPDLALADKIREELESGAASGGAGPAVLSDPVGFATITGVVKLEGAPPPRTKLTLGGDDGPVCSANGDLFSEEVVAGPNGELKNTLIMVSSDLPKDTPGWIHPDYASPPTLLDGAQAFDQKNCVFLSHLYVMRASQRLVIENSDSLGHNTNISGGQEAKAFNQLISAGSAAEYAPGGPSNLPMSVSCNIHPWMKAYMMVCDHPYFAVTGDDGSFELKNVPAGVELELRVWHEAKADFSDPVNGAWKRGRATVKLNDQEPLTLNISAALK